jgi:hypothetical protein
MSIALKGHYTRAFIVNLKTVLLGSKIYGRGIESLDELREKESQVPPSRACLHGPTTLNKQGSEEMKGT